MLVLFVQVCLNNLSYFKQTNFNPWPYKLFPETISVTIFYVISNRNINVDMMSIEKL